MTGFAGLKIPERLFFRFQIESISQAMDSDCPIHEIMVVWWSNAIWLKVRSFYYYQKPFELVEVIIWVFSQKKNLDCFRFSPTFFIALTYGSGG